MATPIGTIGLAAAGVKDDASTGTFYGPGAWMPGGTPYCFSVVGSVGALTTLTVAGAPGAYCIINKLYVSGAGLPASLTSALLTITGPNQNYLRNLWTGPALGLDSNDSIDGWGLVAAAQNTSLVVTVAAIALVTVTITAIGIYI